MKAVSISVHFDGKYILRDEPYPLEPNTKLLVTVLPKNDEDREDWLHLSAQRLADAYNDKEPEYHLSSVREINFHYDRRFECFLSADKGEANSEQGHILL